MAMSRRRRRRGYAQAILIGLDGNRAITWMIFSESIRLGKNLTGEGDFTFYDQGRYQDHPDSGNRREELRRLSKPCQETSELAPERLELKHGSFRAHPGFSYEHHTGKRPCNETRIPRKIPGNTHRGHPTGN